MRGGAFNSSETGVTSSFRLGALPELRSEARGFRCVIRRKNAPAWAVVAFTGEEPEAPEESQGSPGSGTATTLGAPSQEPGPADSAPDASDSFGPALDAPPSEAQ